MREADWEESRRGSVCRHVVFRARNLKGKALMSRNVRN